VFALPQLVQRITGLESAAARSPRFVPAPEPCGFVPPQLVQRIEGRESADAPGDGHCDVCVGVACHPIRNVIVRPAPFVIPSFS